MWVLVTIYTLVMMVLNRDLSPLAYVIGSVDAVVGVNGDLARELERDRSDTY